MYLQDAIEAIDKIHLYIGALDLEEFQSNKMIVDAVIRNFEIIGEAEKRVPDHVRAKFPDIPWKSMVGLRNSVLHDYLGIDNSILYQLARHELHLTKTQFLACLSYVKSIS